MLNYYILYYYNKVSYRKENVIKNHKEEKIHLQYCTVFIEKNLYKWTQSVQTYVVQLHIHCNFFTNSSTNEHLGCFYVLAIINNAVVNMREHVSFLVSVFIFFG